MFLKKISATSAITTVIFGVKARSNSAQDFMPFWRWKSGYRGQQRAEFASPIKYKVALVLSCSSANIGGSFFFFQDFSLFGGLNFGVLFLFS